MMDPKKCSEKERNHEQSEVEMVHNDLYSPEKFMGFYHTLGSLEPKSRRVQLTHSCAAWSERFNFGSTDLWFNGTEAFVH